MTPNLQVVFDYVKANYGLRMGVTNCRRISGSQTWSQHSWSNAVDIHVASKAIGDGVKADLLDRYGDHIRYLLWWRADHYDHLHVDMWPRGWLTPPCAGSPLRIKFEDGTVSSGPFPLTIEEDEIMYAKCLNEAQWRSLYRSGVVGGASEQSVVDYWFHNSASRSDEEYCKASAAIVTDIAELSVASGSEGPQGDTGPSGPEGPRGPRGARGPEGEAKLTIVGTKVI